MKKLLTLVLTLGLCFPMFMTTSVEVRAEEEETYVCVHDGCTNTVENEGDNCEEGQCMQSCTECNLEEPEETYVCVHDGCTNTVENEEDNCEEGQCMQSCTECNTEETETCLHTGYAGCMEELEDGEDLCGACLEGSTAEYWVKDENTHVKMRICACGAVDTFDDSETVHNFDGSGKCTVCGYDPNCGSGNSTPSTPADSAPESAPAPEETTAEEKAAVVAKAVEEKIKAEEAIPVTSFTSAAAVNAIPEEVKGSTAAGAVFNVSQITSTRGFVAAVDKIVKANPEEKSVTFYSSKPFAFNEASVAAMTNTNKEFVYMFNHEGKLYKVTIPAGAKIDLAGQKFAGPLYIGAQLGTSVVVK